jgi:hypothetical protein
MMVVGKGYFPESLNKRVHVKCFDVCAEGCIVLVLLGMVGMVMIRVRGSLLQAEDSSMCYCPVILEIWVNGYMLS